MDAPTTAGNQIKQTKTKNISICSDKNINYEISISIKGENLIFEGKSKDIIPQKIYKKKYTLLDVQQNKYFCFCDNINEVFDELEAQLNESENDVKLMEETNCLILSIPLKTVKIKECLFQIDEQILNANQKFEEFYS